VARIVKTQAGTPRFAGQGCQSLSLGAQHVRHETTQPEEAAAAEIIGWSILMECQFYAPWPLLKIHTRHLNYPILSALLDGNPASRSKAGFLTGLSLNR
jgi:hypothetical protein